MMLHRLLLIPSLFMALLALQPAHAIEEISSFLFADNIRSNGVGDIDLFKPKNNDRVVTGPLLEAFRLDNGGQLVFAVDVNEASAGSEFSDSQGVAVASAQLSVVINGETLQFNSFSSPTRSLLATAGSSERREYYTLIGTTGSNRISGNVTSELTGSSLDEALYFDVDQDLTLATEATLNVILLETNVSLGDPEAFYDFSNGFEDVALLTHQDVLYLEQLTPGLELAPLVITEQVTPTYNWVYYPTSQDYFVASYEDLYPQKGDYDFNDLVVAYQVNYGLDTNGEVAIIRGNGYLLARGAEYDHDWHLRIELPEWASGSTTVSLYPAGSYTPFAGYPKSGTSVGSADLMLAEHVADIYFDGSSTYVNTFGYQTLRQGPKFDFQISLDVAVPVTQIAQAPFDPYLYIHNTSYEVHLVDKQPVLAYSRNTLDGLNTFRDEAGFPFAIVAPDNWQPPLAGIDMGLAYPTFINFVESQGSSNTQWYSAPTVNTIKPLAPEFWKW
jgi:LruC domain-containing protein